MKKIIVPTDFSEHAQKAYVVAASIAKKNNLEIELYTLHKSHVMTFAGFNVFNISTAVSQNLEDGNLAMERLREHAALPVFEGIEVSCVAELNETKDLAQDIYNHINNGEFSLAVVGTEGSEKQDETFAEIIVRHAEIPVVTVKNGLESFAPKEVVICTNFKNLSPGYLKRLQAAMKGFEVTFKLLYVNTPSEFKDSLDIERGFKAFKRMYQMKNVEFVHFDGYTVESGIFNYLKKNPCDMIAFSTHGRHGLAHLFKGSLTEDLVNESAIPVFSYNLHDYNSRHANYTARTTGFVG